MVYDWIKIVTNLKFKTHCFNIHNIIEHTNILHSCTHMFNLIANIFNILWIADENKIKSQRSVVFNITFGVFQNENENENTHSQLCMFVTLSMFTCIYRVYINRTYKLSRYIIYGFTESCSCARLSNTCHANHTKETIICSYYVVTNFTKLESCKFVLIFTMGWGLHSF